jgi:DNA-binding transcriptional regulator YiaG
MYELKKIRQQYGLTQGQLALLLDVPQSTVSRWETGAVEINTIKLIGIISVLKSNAHGTFNSNKERNSG